MPKDQKLLCFKIFNKKRAFVFLSVNHTLVVDKNLLTCVNGRPTVKSCMFSFRFAFRMMNAQFFAKVDV